MGSMETNIRQLSRRIIYLLGIYKRQHLMLSKHCYIFKNFQCRNEG